MSQLQDKPCVVCGKTLNPLQQYAEVNQVMCWDDWRDLCEQESPSETDARALHDLIYVIDEAATIAYDNEMRK